MHAFNDEQYMIADHDHHIVIRQMSVPAGKRAYRRTHPQGKLLAIADGIAGIGGSEVAGMAAMDGVLHYITSAMPWILTGVDDDDDEGTGSTDRVLDNLKHVLVRCEHRLRRVVEGRGVQGPLATAITLAYVMWPDLYVVHAGGSRCYIFRDNHIYWIDSDHALQQPAGSAIVHDGPAQAPAIEAAGAGDSMAGQTGAHHVTLSGGDCILLCTNSLTRYLSASELVQYLNCDMSAATVRDRLIAGSKGSGGTENITIVTCRCE